MSLPSARPSEWPVLFDLATRVIDHVQGAHGLRFHWSFGGGTALMLQIDHRESHDIDLFLDDPQILPFLNPEIQGITLDRQPDGYDSDGAGVLKLVYSDLGEIDFICAPSILDDGSAVHEVRGRRVILETPAEIIAKKVYFRGGRFQPRDMFDLAAVVERYGDDYVVAALRECGADRCVGALETVQKANPVAVRAINAQLMVRDGTRHLVESAQEVSRYILKQVLAGA